jgi:hypothetical protein
VAESEEIVKPGSALDGAHCGTKEFDSITFKSGSRFLSTADVLTRGGVIHLLAEVDWADEPNDQTDYYYWDTTV